MPSRVAVRVVAVVMILALVLSAAATALGQEPDPPGGQVPAPDIIPEPNSGEAPTEAGDRGGALQLLLLAGIVVAVGGIGWHVARQARHARQAPEPAVGLRRQPSSARQKSMPSTNPDR